MGFAQDIQELKPKIDEIMSAVQTLSPENISILRKANSIDFDQVEKVVTASNKIKDSQKDILLIENGIHDIREVVAIQNQVRYVSDIRDQISILAGDRGKEFSKISESIADIELVQNMTDDIRLVLELRSAIEKVIKMEDKIEELSQLNDSIHEGIRISEDLQLRTKQSEESAVNILNEIKIRERNIDEKLKKMERFQEGFENLDVRTTHLPSTADAYARFSKSDWVLELGVPSGKVGPQGEKGERGLQGPIGIPGVASREGKEGKPGKDGKDFSVSASGRYVDRPKYGNRPTGTSFLSLDEVPVTIYFKRSDELNDWTEGQPFGLHSGLIGEVDIMSIAQKVVDIVNTGKTEKD